VIVENIHLEQANFLLQISVLRNRVNQVNVQMRHYTLYFHKQTSSFDKGLEQASGTLWRQDAVL